MNAWGLVVVTLALILVYIGATGSQASVWAAITGHKSSTPATTAVAPQHYQ